MLVTVSHPVSDSVASLEAFVLDFDHMRGGRHLTTRREAKASRIGGEKTTRASLFSPCYSGLKGGCVLC